LKRAAHRAAFLLRKGELFPFHLVLIVKGNNDVPKKTKFSEWSRECPICKKPLYYSCKRYLNRAINNGSSCNTCRKISDKQKQQIREYNLKNGVRPPNRTKEYREKEVHTHFKKCPRCNKEMGYTSKRGLKTAINGKTLCHSCAGIVYKTNNNRITDEATKKMRATKAGFNSWEEYLEKYPLKKQYKAKVWSHTYKQPLKTLEHFDKRGRCGVEGAWQIDHIISVDEGWKKNIDAKIIGHISNIQMLPWKKNLEKSNNT